MQNLKSKYEQKEMHVSDGLWDRLEEKLDQVPAKKKKPKMIWWRFVAVIVLILNFGGISWMTDIKNKVEETPEFIFPRIENQISTVKEQSKNNNEIQKPIPIKNISEIDNKKLAVENVNSSISSTIKKENQTVNLISEKEIPIKKEEIAIPKPEEKLAQNDASISFSKEKPIVKYVSSSDLLFGVEIDKAKSETPKSAMGINVSKPKNDSDFPNPKRIKLFGITLYDKDSITTK